MAERKQYSNISTEPGVPPKVTKVVKGEVKKRKKSSVKKFVSHFISDSVNTILPNLVEEIIIPALQDTVIDSVTSGVEMLFKGSDTGEYTKTYRNSGKSKLNYSGISTGKSSRSLRKNRREIDEFTLRTRAEATEVLDLMHERILKYDMVTIADLNDWLGVSGEYTDFKYGWTDLSGATIKKVRDGYTLVLPRTEVLD